MSSSFKSFGSEDLDILDHTQASYWQYSRKDSKDILLYTEKSAIYETPRKEKFREGSDVLVRWTDGLLYLANIIKVEEEYNRCAVKFEDGSQYWSLYKDIYKGPPANNEVICAVCDTDTSDPPDEIVICDKCSVGYHQYCHIPKIDSSVLKPEVSWACRKCVFANTTKKGGAIKKGSKAQAMQVMKLTLPYDMPSLTWDAPHRSNLQQTYCYCGGPGEWYMKMLQCLRCKQWFHEACLQCLEEALLFGDRFFIFVCAICNKGTEFIRRLALRWPDIVHLVLFNLTILYGKKYFDLDTSIMQFMKEKWSQLQVKGEELSRSTIDEKKQKVIETFQGNKSRFISGKELKRKTTIWGLRSRVPPPVPVIILPESIPLTDNVLDSFKAGKKTKSMVKAENTPIRLKRQLKPPSDPPLSNDAFDTSSQNSAIQSQNEEKMEEEKPKKWQRRRLRSRSVRKFSHSSKHSELSDSEDTSSSHGTLNSIIPHPNNFEGPNNPFITSDRSCSSSKSEDQKSSVTTASTASSETTEDQKSSVTTASTASSETTEDQKSSVTTASTASSETIKVAQTRRLRHRRNLRSNSKNPNSMITNLIGDPPKPVNLNSTVEKNSIETNMAPSSMSELNSSMNDYFGAENRIANGEKFCVLAKRVGKDGRTQYLIEWESLSS